MKKLFSILVMATVVCGCTMIPTQHGTAQFWGDYQDVSLDDGDVTFKAKQMVHSGAVKAHYHGLIGLGAEAVAFGAGGPVVGTGVAGVTSFVNRPTNRATPTLKATPTPAK